MSRLGKQKLKKTMPYRLNKGLISRPPENDRKAQQTKSCNNGNEDKIIRPNRNNDKFSS